MVASEEYKNVHEMEDGYWQAWLPKPTSAETEEREECEERAGREKNVGFKEAESSKESRAGASSSKKEKAGDEGAKVSRGPYVGRAHTEQLAARAQDRGLLKLLENPNVKVEGTLNFPEEDYVADRRLRETLEDEEFFELLRSEARPTYNRVEQTQLLKEFWLEEQMERNITRGKAPKPLGQFLFELLLAREGDIILPEGAKRLIAKAKRTVAKPTSNVNRTGLRSTRRRCNPSVEAMATLQSRTDS